MSSIVKAHELAIERAIAPDAVCLDLTFHPNLRVRKLRTQQCRLAASRYSSMLPDHGRAPRSGGVKIHQAEGVPFPETLAKSYFGCTVPPGLTSSLEFPWRSRSHIVEW